MARDRYKIRKDHQPHFLSCTVVNWLPVFSRPEAAQVVLDSLSYLQSEEELVLYCFVIMENHLHMIASSENGLADVVGRFKSFTARKIIDLLVGRQEKFMLRQFRHAKLAHKKDRMHQFWQEGNHPVLMQNDEIMRQKAEYVHYNPVRRGYVDDPVHWRYSSARNYSGMEGLLEVTRKW